MEDGLNIILHENVFTSPEEIFEKLEREIVYLPEELSRIRIKNKSYPISRKIVAFGDPGLSYTFSGLTLTSQPWSSLLLEIKVLIENLLGISFNFVLINRYEDGNACIGQHKDDESDLEENHPICSLSFGETRTMVFKRSGFPDKRIQLKSNSLLVMNPPTNKFWTHGIPKQSKRSGVRINLTFRMMKPSIANDVTPNKRKHVENEGSHKKTKEEKCMDETVRGKVQWRDSADMKHLGGENFLTVNEFAGQTRVHIRRYVADKDGVFHATKDGVSLTPKVWRSFCSEVRTILNHKSPEKMIVVERDLCISKQVKDGAEVYVFQRLFQRKNMSLQFVSEHVVLTLPELQQLVYNINSITDRVKEGLITYTLSYHISEELSNTKLESNPTYNCYSSEQLYNSLCQCLTAAISLKITELLNCFGCRESYQADFMHDCLTISRSEKWEEYFEQALYTINLRDVAKDIVQKNLNMDFQYVLGQEEFFDGLIVSNVFDSLEKIYVEENDKLEEIVKNICN